MGEPLDAYPLSAGHKPQGISLMTSIQPSDGRRALRFCVVAMMLAILALADALIQRLVYVIGHDVSPLIMVVPGKAPWSPVHHTRVP